MIRNTKGQFSTDKIKNKMIRLTQEEYDHIKKRRKKI